MYPSLEQRIAVLVELPALALIATVRGNKRPDDGVAAIILGAENVALHSAQTTFPKVVRDAHRVVAASRSAGALRSGEKLGRRDRRGFVRRRPRSRVGCRDGFGRGQRPRHPRSNDRGKCKKRHGTKRPSHDLATWRFALGPL